MACRLVLVVEDDADLRAAIPSRRRSYDYTVLAAEDGERGLEVCAENAPKDATQLGVAACLPKPFDTRMLLELVDRPCQGAVPETKTVARPT